LLSKGGCKVDGFVVEGIPLPKRKENPMKVAEVVEKPKTWTAVFFNGTFESGREVVDALVKSEVDAYKLVYYGNEVFYIEDDKRLLIKPKNWLVFPFIDPDSGGYVAKWMSDEQFKSRYQTYLEPSPNLNLTSNCYPIAYKAC
jgi:hypothetical protein